MQRNIWVAYFLWFLGFFGLFGVHRFYLGKPLTGVLWFFTGGVFFIGQILDFFLIPLMVKESQPSLPGGYAESQLPLVNSGRALGQQVLNKLDYLDHKMQRSLSELRTQSQSAPANPEPILTPLQKLLEVAAAHNNVISLGIAVKETRLPLDTVEELLQECLRKDLARIDNDPETGAIRYHFDL